MNCPGSTPLGNALATDLLFTSKTTIGDFGVAVDVVEGDLFALRGSGSFDFTADCGGDGVSGAVSVTAEPAVGGGLYYLARRNGCNATWSSLGAGEAVGRDASLSDGFNNPATCP